MSTDATPAPPHPSVERLAPDDPRLSFDGITGWSRDGGGDGADGLLPLRMPLERLGTTLSANLTRLARTNAGVRFAVRTDAVSIELEVENGSGGSPWTSGSTASSPTAGRAGRAATGSPSRCPPAVRARRRWRCGCRTWTPPGSRRSP